MQIEKSQTKDHRLKSLVKCGEGVRHPSTPIQRILPSFNLFPILTFYKEIEYLTFWFFFFLKSFYKQYIYTHMWVNIYV